jgi:SAM-dependent methyltransferase
MTVREIPFPPLDMANRVGSLEGVPDPYAYYDELGRRAREDLLRVLPDGWSFDGKRVLDFGAGAGRTLRQFGPEAERAEFWGCDIHGGSVEWMAENLVPPFHVFRNDEHPPLDRPDGFFDLIWCVSVFTHLTDSWSAWLLELRRVLAPGGVLIVTFMGRGMSEVIVDQPWDEERIGMNVLRLGQSWDAGGPMVLHSPWWIREHWGRAFDVLEIREEGFAVDPPVGQGTVVLRSNGARVTREDLERVDPGDPRELRALQHNLSTMADEVLELRRSVDWLESQVAGRTEAHERLERAHRAVLDSPSWRLTQPLRVAKRRVLGLRAGRHVRG